MENFDVKENKILLDLINNKLQESSKKYYKDVLEFLNMLFDTEEKSILKIKMNKISLNEDILETYNYIVKKHELKKDLINTQEMNFELDYDKKDIVKMVLLISNNLLEKINYKMMMKKFNDKEYLKIIKM